MTFIRETKSILKGEKKTKNTISLSGDQIDSLIRVNEEIRRGSIAEDRSYHDEVIAALNSLVDDGYEGVEVCIEDVLSSLGAVVESSNGLGAIFVKHV